ncbi:MAG: 2,3-bisphosphoglycerate-independent phosphoglycerate mutase [Patescibacteria group bacterium]|nr:2,3-bisphosphoglycerate-independent phosphoglycerate mutase [Patescibacteria group bacterium]
MIPKPLMLIILDGWGIAPDSEGNGITRAKTPFFDTFVKKYPTTALHAAGPEVGLPWGMVGNSEVGHMNIGSGLVCYQTLPRINKTIEDKSFFKNKALVGAMGHANQNKSTLHLLGLASPGGVHSHIDHLYALLELAKSQKVKNVVLHIFLDGRDTLYNAGLNCVKQLEERIKKIKVGKIATICGRFYAMDRDNRWDRIQASYQAITEGVGVVAKDSIKAVEQSYAKKVYDEEFLPTVVKHRGGPLVVKDNDAVIFFNFRPDRARQMTKAFVLPKFMGFKRKPIKNLFFTTMTEYEQNLPLKVAYPAKAIEAPLARVVSDLGKTQFHIAETEKYAHVTFFLNGMTEDPFPGEERAIIPSLGVASYDKKPEMSADEVTKRIIKEINSGKQDFIVVNFANSDIVGHTGSIPATKKAVETVDKCLNKIIELLVVKGGAAIITADHGNAEELINLQTGEMDKEHSTNPVPFILVHQDIVGQKLFPEIPGGDLSLAQPTGILADITPTVLSFLGQKQGAGMTGHPLI